MFEVTFFDVRRGPAEPDAPAGIWRVVQREPTLTSARRLAAALDASGAAHAVRIRWAHCAYEWARG